LRALFAENALSANKHVNYYRNVLKTIIKYFNYKFDIIKDRVHTFIMRRNSMNTIKEKALQEQIDLLELQVMNLHDEQVKFHQDLEQQNQDKPCSTPMYSWRYN
jgi:hypothetical protein